MDGRFLPALASGDRTALAAIHANELLPVYGKQNAEILELVELSAAYRTRMNSRNFLVVAATLALVALISLVLVAAMALAARLIRTRIAMPLDATAQSLQRMADGDYDLAFAGHERSDEIGMMARAAEIFRTTGLAKREADRVQQQVVETLSVGLSRMADRDLEHRIDTAFAASYEQLRQDYNEAIDALARAMGTVRVGASSVTASLGDLRLAADDLALRNEHQAASLEEASATMTVVTNGVRTTARSAADAQNAVEQAHRKAAEGGEVVRQAVEAMAAIENSAGEIAQITSLIDGIAFQTNLLALNAGVEAARAGPAGAGFAVVANEVRALAQRSAEAAQSIKDLIAASATHVTDGVALVGDTGEKLREIVGQVSAISRLVTDIAASTENQAEKLQAINDTVGALDRMTQQNAAMVEQSTAATSALADEAVRLTELVSTFRTRLPSREAMSGQAGEAMRRRIAVELDTDAQDRAPRTAMGIAA
jgi:methyl-accepting chemotaxis protein